MTNDLKTSTIANLDESLDGRVIRPGDPGYDESRQVFYGGHDLRPAIIVRAAGADDVARTIGVARETGLELAVRSGGHSGAGHGSTRRRDRHSISRICVASRSTSRNGRRGPGRAHGRRVHGRRRQLTASRPGSGIPARSASAGSRWAAASASSSASTA